MLVLRNFVRSNYSRGFSLLELLVTIALSTILASVAVVRIDELLRSFARRNAEMQVLQDMRLAQSKTVEQGCRGILLVDVDQQGYKFGCDYVPFSIESPPVWDSVLFTRNLDSRFRMSSDNLIIFNTKGQTVDESGTLDTRTVTLSETSGGALETFNTGTLRPTGFFIYSH